MLNHLADRIEHIFSQDTSFPQHEQLDVTVYHHSKLDETCYSTSYGTSLSSPFAGERFGFFAVIHSSIMRLALTWPAMTFIPVVNSLEDSLYSILDENNVALCIGECALVIWAACVEDLIASCIKINEQLVFAKCSSYNSNSSISHESGCGGILSGLGDHMTESWNSELCCLGGLDSVEEPFLGGWTDPRIINGDMYSQHLFNQEPPELDFSFSDSSAAPSSWQSFSPLSLTLSISSPSTTSPLPTTPLLSQNWVAQKHTPLYQSEELHESRMISGPAISISLREISFDPRMETSPEAEACGDIYSPMAPLPTAFGHSLSPIPASSPAKLPQPKSTPSLSSEERSGRRSRRIATRASPYNASPRPCVSISLSLLNTPLSDLSSLPSSPARSSLALSDIDGDFCKATEQREPRKQQKRKRGSRKRFHCEFCTEYFTREADVERHLKSCNSNPTREAKKSCSYCSKSLPVRDDAKERHWKSMACQAEAHRRGLVPGTLDYY